MPFRPAASITANAKYGLHAESSARYSARVDWPLPGLYMGTRTRADLLLCPQHTYAGASPPPISRLNEFTHWHVIAVISGACLSRPAMNDRPVFDSWYCAPAS